MNFAILFIGCLIIVLPRNVESFEIINDFVSAIFYQTPLTNIRHLEIAQSIKNNYVIKDTMGLAEQYKYSAEKHTVTTEDGYILTFFRISGSPTVPPADGKPVVFMQHGVGACSDSWALFGDGYDLVKFRPWDYGHTDNVKIYGTNEPPDYNVTKILAPCAFIYGHKDPLAQEKSVVALARRVENVVALEEVPYSSFNHIDFMWATNAKALLYNRVIDLISKYSP